MANYSRARINAIVIAGRIILGVCIIAIIVSVYITGITTDNVLHVINESIDTVSLIFCGLILFSCGRDLKINDDGIRESLFFFMMMILNSFGVFLDFFCWKLQGIPEMRLCNFIVYTCFYCVGPLGIYVFWKYTLISITTKKNRLVHIFSIMQDILIVVAEIFVFLNIFWSIFFTVDDVGVYSRTTWPFVINAVPNVLMIFMTIHSILSSEERIVNKLVLSGYGIVPIAAAVIQKLFFGVSIMYTITSCMAFLIYIDIHSKRNLEMQEMKLKIMYSQMQPHFIVNGMASIRGLIRKSPEDAVTMMNYFISYLRGSLDIYGNNKLITIEQEINFVRDYLTIENIRFAGKIDYIIEEPDEIFYVPPLSIQPLVENAIRHGIRKKKDGCGTVCVKLSSDKRYHVIQVIDDGVGFDTNQKLEGSSHIGIDNTKRRIKRMTEGTLTVFSKIGGGTTIEIKIPKR